MKVTIEINGNPVEIELTAEQVAKATKKATHYTDIKTLEDALDYIGESIESFNFRTQFDDDAQRAYKELEVITLAIRQGNELGHNEGDRWYYPWFYAKRSSSGFSYPDCYYDYSVSLVASRLCVESSEKAEYIGKTFIDIYDRYINASDLSQKSTPEPTLKPKKFNSYSDIKTFDDACAAVGVDPVSFHNRNKHLSDDTYAYEQLKIISKALNGGSHMDYEDTDEYKYYPWFNSVGSSSGFSYLVFDFDPSTSRVASRLTYKTSDIAKYAGTQFLDIYSKYIN